MPAAPEGFVADEDVLPEGFVADEPKQEKPDTFQKVADWLAGKGRPNREQDYLNLAVAQPSTAPGKSIMPMVSEFNQLIEPIHAQSPAAQFALAVAKQPTKFLEGMTTPEMAPAAVAGPIAPKLLQAGMAGLMAKGAYDSVSRIKDWINAPGEVTPEEKQKLTDLIVEGAGSAYLAGRTGAELIPKAKAPIQGPIATGEVLPMPKGFIPTKKGPEYASEISKAETSVPSGASGRGGESDHIRISAGKISNAIRQGDAGDLQLQLEGSGLDQDQLRRAMVLLPKEEQAALQAFGKVASGGRPISEAAQEAIAVFNNQKRTGGGNIGIPSDQTKPVGTSQERSSLEGAQTPETIKAETEKTEQERKLDYASQDRTAKEIYGALRPQPIEGTGQVPVKESGAGVLAPPEETKSEILLTPEAPPAPKPSAEVPGLSNKEVDELSALREKDRSEDGLSKEEESRMFELSRKEAKSKRAAKTSKEVSLLRDAGIVVPDDFLNPSEGVENHVTGWTKDSNGFIQVRVESHTPETMSARLITVKPGDKLTHGMDDSKPGTTRINESSAALNRDVEAGPPEPVTPSTPEGAVPAAPSQTAIEPTISQPKAKGKAFDLGAAGRKAKANYESAISAASDADAVEMRSPKYPNLRVIITKDPSETGKWRATRVDEKGPSGHNIYNSREEAISDYTGGHKTSGPSWGWDFKVVSARKLQKEAPKPATEGVYEQTVRGAAQSTKITPADIEILNRLESAKPQQGQLFPKLEDLGVDKKTIRDLIKRKLVEPYGNGHILTVSGRFAKDIEKVSKPAPVAQAAAEVQPAVGKAKAEIPRKYQQAVAHEIVAGNLPESYLGKPVIEVAQTTVLKGSGESTTYHPYVTVRVNGQQIWRGTAGEFEGQMATLFPKGVLPAGKAGRNKLFVERISEPAQPPPAAGLGVKHSFGGAVPAEFGERGDFVSNMFAVIDKDRAEMGKPPMEPTTRRTWDEDNQRALAQMNRDPEWIPKLLDSVERSPRPLLSWENAGVVWYRAKLKAEYNNALQRVARAFDDQRTDDLNAAKVDSAVFEDKLDRLDRVVGRNGTGSEAGRSLAAQKMGAGDDFTLVEMTLRKRAAVGGRKLTPEETSALQKQVEQLNTLNAELQRSLADADARRAKAEADKAVAEIKAQAAPTFDKRILAHAESIVRKMEEAAKPAAVRLKEALLKATTIDPTTGAHAGLDISVIQDAATVMSAKIARYGLDLAKRTDDMVREFGEAIRPHIPQIWDEANKMIDAIKAPEPVKRAIKKTDLNELKQATIENVKDKISKKQTDKITWQVQNLARAFVKSGVTDREALIDAVHDVIKDAIPGQTRRQTMDMISGYGDFKRLTKEAITVQLRGMKGEMQQLAKLEDMAMGKPPLKTGLERRTPTDAERQLIKAVNDAKNKFQVPITDPETQLKSSLDTLKTTLENRIKDYEDRLARKDYAPRPRREVVLDARANELKVKAERIKKRFRDELIADRLKNRFGWEKTMDWATKYRRAGVLSSPVVIPKLISAGLQRLASLPLEEGIGAAYSKVPGYRAVSKMAPLEGGGLNLRAEMRGYGAAFTKGLQDAYNVLKTGHSDLDVLYGKSGESYTGEFEMMSRLLSLPGRLHGMIKAPVKRAVFERAVQRYGDFYARQGLDPGDPVVMTRIAVDAYKAANRSIFLNDNFVASKVQGWLSEHRPKGELHPTFGSKVWSTAGRVALPITRVPINIVAETMQYVGGLASGNIRLAAALRRGVETLKPEEADLIMRELKKGSIGAAVLALGYFNANAIGGYYQPGKKQKPGEQKYGTIRVYDVNIPSYLLHNPLLETLQVGATVRHVAESHLRKKDTTPEGIGWGVYAAGLGMVEQVPFMREMAEIEKARNPYVRGSFVGEQAKSILVPSIVQKTAEWTDPAAKRKPKTVLQHIQTGIPGLREQVPTK